MVPMMEVTNYRELIEVNPVKARQIMIRTYLKLDHKIRATARALGMNHATVIKWVERWRKEEGLEDRSRRPKNSPRQIPKEWEERIKEERLKTNFGRKRLSRWLLDHNSISISHNTLAHVFKRLGINRPQKKRARLKGVHYYNWPNLKPFEHGQIDTKDVKDSRTLPREVYTHLIREKLPRYQWTYIDVKTRVKFLAYSHELSLANGLAFMNMIVHWLRSYGISYRIYLQSDWGSEFGGHSLRKILELQRDIFEPMNVQLLRIRKRKWTDNAYVERTHRTDDEEFYIPKLLQIFTLEDHFKMSWGYVWHFNTLRPHYGEHMGEKTPYEVLKKFCPDISRSICALPPIRLDTVSSSNYFITDEDRPSKNYLPLVTQNKNNFLSENSLKNTKSGYDVFDTYSNEDLIT